MTAGRIVIGGTDCTDHIKALVDQAPPLTPEQRDQLREILAPGRPIIAARLRARRSKVRKAA